jgi:hypothetical protein
MKPVEFTNGNVYKGGWSSEMKMEGQGKYYLIIKIKIKLNLK